METFTVKLITEADYGCEESGHTEPMALIILASDEKETTLEVSERILKEQGICEGKQVCFTSDGEMLKYVRVVAAVIRNNSDGKIKIFATARGYGKYKGWWEFPGGKIEAGETPEEALIREIKEELTVDIRVYDLIQTLEYDYPDFHLSMDCFWAEIVNGQPVLKEAEAAKWLSIDELDSVEWLPSDQILVGRIKTQYPCQNISHQSALENDRRLSMQVPD